MVVMKLFIFWGNFFDARLRKAGIQDTAADNGVERKLSRGAQIRRRGLPLAFASSTVRSSLLVPGPVLAVLSFTSFNTS
jgi:hypothetical protein